MSLGKFARLSSVFVVALIFGLGWVGMFRFFVSEFETPLPETSPLQSKTVGQATALGDEPVISMDDKIFTPPQVDENNPEAFDPEGIYTVRGILSPGHGWDEPFTVLQYITKRPELFEPFEPLGLFIDNKKLDVDCDDGDFGKLEPATGEFFVNNTKREKDHEIGFEIRDLRISDGKIKFNTVTQNNNSFSFAGEFLVKGNFYTLDPKIKVLEGIVTRIENGKKVSETEVSFTWSIDLTCVC